MKNKTEKQIKQLTGRIALAQAQELHREIKKDLLDIMSRLNVPNNTKQQINDQLFKLYMKIK